MSLVLIHGQKAIFRAPACKRCVCCACLWFCARCFVTWGKRKAELQLTSPSLSGKSRAGTFSRQTRNRAVSHLGQVPVPWHRLVPGAQRPAATPCSSAPLVSKQSAIQPRWFCKEKRALARVTDVRVTFLASWLVHRESTLL